VLAAETQQLFDLDLTGLVVDAQLNTLQVGVLRAQVAR